MSPTHARPASLGDPTASTPHAANYFDNDPDGTPLALHEASGNSNYYIRDGQGSVVALLNSNGTVTGSYTYDPYGTQTAQTGTNTAVNLNPYRYTGGILDRGTGWLKHGTRWNDTSTGRWATTDPITRLNDPNNANPYQYAGGDPTNRIDPTGRFDFLEPVLSAVAGYAVTITCVAGVTLVTGGVDLLATPGVIYGCQTLGWLAGVGYSYVYEQAN